MSSKGTLTQRKLWPVAPSMRTSSATPMSWNETQHAYRVFVKIEPENTHLLCKGKHHCAADLMFYTFGFSCFACDELTTYLLAWLHANPSTRKSVILTLSEYSLAEWSLVWIKSQQFWETVHEIKEKEAKNGPWIKSFRNYCQLTMLLEPRSSLERKRRRTACAYLKSYDI